MSGDQLLRGAALNAVLIAEAKLSKMRWAKMVGRIRSLNQLIDLREKLQENPRFHGNIDGFRLRFSLFRQPIDWSYPKWSKILCHQSWLAGKSPNWMEVEIARTISDEATEMELFLICVCMWCSWDFFMMDVLSWMMDYCDSHTEMMGFQNQKCRKQHRPQPRLVSPGSWPTWHRDDDTMRSPQP